MRKCNKQEYGIKRQQFYSVSQLKWLHRVIWAINVSSLRNIISLPVSKAKNLLCTEFWEIEKIRLIALARKWKRIMNQKKQCTR